MARNPTVVPFPAAPWVTLLRRDGRGRAYPDLANVLIALRNAPELKDAFGFDEMRQETTVRAALPRIPGAGEGEQPPKSLTDDDVSRVQEWLQHMSLPRIGREIVGQAIEWVAFVAISTLP